MVFLRVLRLLRGRWGPTQHCQPQRHHACTFFNGQFGPSEQFRAVFSRFRRKIPWLSAPVISTKTRTVSQRKLEISVCVFFLKMFVLGVHFTIGRPKLRIGQFSKVINNYFGSEPEHAGVNESSRKPWNEA